MKADLDRLRDIFAKAMRIESGGEREKFLAEACRGDAELRSQVETLLDAHDRAGDFLAQTMRLPMVEFESERMGSVIGRYKLLEKIGEGGFGVVYMAEQQEPVQRKVALKIIKAGMDTREVIARFEAERQALALMDHPNIAKVLDAGTTETKRPYFVMELVRGIPITDYCDEKNLSTPDRLRLFVKVCQAVQHAHQKAVIHRDLKPSNILVTLHDGEPVPKVIDFGVAKALGQKLTEKTLFTSFRQMIGTPAYMSPEQAEMSGLDIDTRSDIYSLGVLLYELLTGVTPFDKETLAKAALDEIRRMIRETEPPKPSTRLRTLGERVADVAKHRRTEPIALSRVVRGDLDWIVMKCLEKDRTRRYETANGLGMELKRFLNNEPVAAGPPGTLYRATKFVHRHKAALASTVTLAALLAAGIIVSTLEAVRANRNATEAARLTASSTALAKAEQNQRTRAERLTVQLRENLYCADVRLAQQALEAGNWGQARDLLKPYQAPPPGGDLRGFEWYYVWNLCQGDGFREFRGHSNIVTAVAFSPDGGILASGGWDKTVKIWDIARGACEETLSIGSSIISLDFSADGNFLAIGSDTGVKIWSRAERRNVFELVAERAYVAFSPRASLVAVGTEGRRFGGGGHAEIWDYVKTNKIASFEECGARVAFGPDGKTLVAGDWNGSIQQFDLESGAILGTVNGTGDVSVLALAADGRTLATVNDWSGKVTLWDIRAGVVKSILTGHTGRVWGMAFSPDGTLLATASSDQTVRLWDVALGEERRALRGHGSEVWSVAFSHDGKILASGSKDETVLLWKADRHGKVQAHTIALSRPVFARTGALAVKNGEDSMQIFGKLSGKPISVLHGYLRALDFSPDGTGLIVARFSGAPSEKNEQTLLAVESCNLVDGTSVALATYTPPIENVTSIKLSPDHSVAAARTIDGTIRVWEMASGQLLKTFHYEPGEASELAFSPNGLILCWGTPSRSVAFLDWSTGTMLAERGGHKDGIFAVAFCPRGQLAASASTDGTVRLWNTVTFTEITTLSGHKEGVIDVAFSPDGRTLASSSDRTVKLWSASTWRELAIIKLEEPAPCVAFSPDGQNLITISGQQLIPWSINKAPTESEGTGLVSQWLAEGNAAETSGNNSGIIHGNVNFVEGVKGQAFEFSGAATDFVEVPHNPNLDLSSESTLMAWVCLDEPPSDARRIMQIMAKSQPGNDLDLQVESDNRVRFWVGPGIAVSSTSILHTGIWYQVTATYAANDRAELFINGNREGVQRIKVARKPNENPMTFGGNTVWPNRGLHGKLDELKVFDRALSATAIRSIYDLEVRGGVKP